MRETIALCHYRLFLAGFLNRQQILLAGLVLASSFWLAPRLTAQGAAELAPEEMIQANLPQGKTVGTAGKAELMEALRSAVIRWPKNTSAIVRAAVSARKSLRAEILSMAILCAREKHEPYCAWVVSIASEWSKAEPGSASEIADVVATCAPECNDALQEALDSEGGFDNTRPPINSLPNSAGVSSSQGQCIVCRNNHEVQISCSNLGPYLRSHPGDTAGVCQATPSDNR